jgi:hypothetical protein
MERALAANPNDRGLRITLLSARRMAERAEAELVDAARSYDMDLCRYRVRRIDDTVYPAVSFAESIVAYQNLFTALYDYVKNGAKAAAKYSNEVHQGSMLNLAYTFPGSLGALLAITNRRDLFDEGELDQVISAMAEVVELQSIDEVRSIAREKGLNVVRNVFKWARQNWDAEFSVDIQWTRSDAVVRGGHFPRAKFLEITSLIEQTSDEEPGEFEVDGTLVGLHVLSDTFSISSNGDTYSGRLAAGFHKRQYKVPGQYRATILSTTTTKYATEAVVVKYELARLEELAT